MGVVRIEGDLWNSSERQLGQPVGAGRDLLDIGPPELLLGVLH